MKKLRPQVIADLVERIKGEFGSFEEGLRELMNYSNFLGAKLDDSEKEVRKRNREINDLKKDNERHLKNNIRLAGDKRKLERKNYKLYVLKDGLAELLNKRDWDELREKYNREVHKRETLELKCKQLEHNAKVKDVAEFSDAIAALLGLDKETLGKSTSITIKVELGEIFLSTEGYIPLEKLTN
jgi:predicted RNase H-like nuclease (RuvC/YqgF family)